MNMKEMSKISKLPLWMVYTYSYLLNKTCSHPISSIRVFRWHDQRIIEDIVVVDYYPNGSQNISLQDYLDGKQNG